MTSPDVELRRLGLSESKCARVDCAELLMALTARSHGFFDKAIVGWSHAARSDITYKKSAAKIVFAIFILIHRDERTWE